MEPTLIEITLFKEKLFFEREFKKLAEIHTTLNGLFAIHWEQCDLLSQALLQLMGTDHTGKTQSGHPPVTIP